MNETDLVTSLEQSKRLKELGAPQDTSFFTWSADKAILDEHMFFVSSRFRTKILVGYQINVYAAYTLSELIDWLGDDFEIVGRAHPKDRFQAVSPNGDLVEGKTPIDALVALAEQLKGKE